jgi:hypothetical protein
MTYQVVVEAQGKPVVVKVEASNETTAHAIARWLVEHAARLQEKEKENTKAR